LKSEGEQSLELPHKLGVLMAFSGKDSGCKTFSDVKAVSRYEELLTVEKHWGEQQKCSRSGEGK
jgi:hypothetical protein